MTGVGMTWWCEAYGPPPEDGPPEMVADWPRCFVEELNGGCLNPVRCAAAMTAERLRVYHRIQEMAARGDAVGVILAEEFTSPDQMLGGRQTRPS